MKRLLITLFTSLFLISSCGGSSPSIISETSSEEIISSEEAPSSVKSEYELFLEAHPDYYGNEEDYYRDLRNDMLNERYEYDVVSLDLEEISPIRGEVIKESNYFRFSEAIVEMDETIILPIANNGEWSISIKGIMNTNGQYLVNKHLDQDASGRVYFGINPNNGLFIGVNIDGNFHNYCFAVPSSYLLEDHKYQFSYSDSTYYLSIDDGAKQGFATININQATNTILEVSDTKKASQELSDKIRAVTGEKYITLDYIGAENFTAKMQLEYLNASTGYIYNYKGYASHPLKDKMIFQLGSSISYGHGSNGRSFVEQIASITSSLYQKETVSGTTLAKRAGQSNSYVERFLKFDFSKNPDYLIIQLSTNDFVNGVSFGKVDETPVEDSDPLDFDQYTITGAIEYLISKSLELNPNIKIYLYSCPIKFGWSARNNYQLFLNTVMPVIVDKWGIGLIDLFNANNLSAYYYMADDIHPNAYGYGDIFTPNMVNKLLDDIK